MRSSCSSVTASLRTPGHSRIGPGSRTALRGSCSSGVRRGARDRVCGSLGDASGNHGDLAAQAGRLRAGRASERRKGSSSSAPSSGCTRRGPYARNHASTEARGATHRRPTRAAPAISPRRHAAMIVRRGPGTVASTSTSSPACAAAARRARSRGRSASARASSAAAPTSPGAPAAMDRPRLTCVPRALRAPPRRAHESSGYGLSPRLRGERAEQSLDR